MEAQIEKAIELRKQANFKILTRLAQIIECSPHLRFQQILSNYKVCELGKDKFYEESIETLRNLEAAFNNMIAENLFVANVDKDLLWMGCRLKMKPLDKTITAMPVNLLSGIMVKL